GAEHSLLLIFKYLDRAQWQPHLVCAGGPLAEEALRLGISVHIQPMPRLRRSPRCLLDWLGGAKAIAQLARQSDAALLYANTVRAAFYGAMAAQWARRPFIWHMRDFWLGESRPRYPWMDTPGKALLCAVAHRVVANSQAVARQLPCRHKVVVNYNGIELQRFHPTMDGQLFREDYHIPAQAPLVGMVGRLRPWKGQDRFLRMAAQVRTRVAETWFVIVGGAIFDPNDQYLQQLRTLATNLGIAERVVFTGHLADVRPALAAMDVFVHPGEPEPFGLVNIEAMAMGKPVVAFAHGALPEIVVDRETGLLVPPEDEVALAEAVSTLLQDRALRKRMGETGRARVEAQFTAQRMVETVEQVLEEALR
ncbi:MAG: glycosyltransferase family 4 protein, partial [Chloroflexi bacterium]|nr:glycosyltransferase family 4 protein [Chloroflexota bacterium]